ncbi:MAG: hypothetical protein PHU85_08015, partial [Phycisphaerae bacterium]|nr:hypothetical protein [Phycisphaerae bacterium]
MSPDGRWLVYGRYDPKNSNHWLVLHDLSAGKDRELDIPPFSNGDTPRRILSSPLFNSADAVMIFFGQVDADGDGKADRNSGTAYRYDLAKGKVTQLDLGLRSPFVLRTRDRNTVIAVAMTPPATQSDARGFQSAAYRVALDERKPFKLNVPARMIVPAGAPCPTADVVSVATIDDGERKGRLVLLDYVEDKVIAEFILGRAFSRTDNSPPRWSRDGRYLCVLVDPAAQPGATPATQSDEASYVSLIWDRQLKKEVSRVAGAAPIAAGPTDSTLLMQRMLKWEFFIYDVTSGRSWPLPAGIAPCCVERDILLYNKDPL